MTVLEMREIGMPDTESDQGGTAVLGGEWGGPAHTVTVVAKEPENRLMEWIQ